ncbi:MAG TPA: galactokinase family protein [Oscillospiraceae bacterium]|nr:galactokinase family protein [Oscillospiraceae bacterium]HPF55336.1 galactokinase family protein [Clostridiales bacterium]HPK36080.1 galactokinase family protein [Oscillospiraceae bacterium]HPR76490.1 galactokinase family protein [Oscillospiraceae bacterium]
MKCRERFEQIYHHEPESMGFCPYRVCPIGAHSDHQYGKITGFAIDQGIHIAYAPKQNGVIELVSLNFDKRAQFHIHEVPKQKQNDWADYLRGATLLMGKKYQLQKGLAGVVEGDLPIGGLSSSAAVIIAFLSALCKVNEIMLRPEEMIELALRAENDYVGVACGTLDQSCEIYSRKDHLLYLDTKDDSRELIPANVVMKPYEIVIFFSGIERMLGGTKYNMRVDECKAAAYALMGFSGMEYGDFKDARLRDISRKVFERYQRKLPENWRKRAVHFYTEFERVEQGVEAWRKGDIEKFGQLCFESGKSSIVNYETGSPELIALYEIMRKTDGIYGGRFSGAGFKGCCMALIDPAFRDSIEKAVTSEYLKQFPNLADKFSVHFCQTADGVRL